MIKKTRDWGLFLDKVTFFWMNGNYPNSSLFMEKKALKKDVEQLPIIFCPNGMFH
jgi:hypothetical protein